MLVASRPGTVVVSEGDLEASPLAKVGMPRLEKRIPPPFTPEGVRKLLAKCNRNAAMGARDCAIVLTLLDSGLRAAEFCNVRIGDLNMRSGLTTVLGKGQKQRTVRVGSKARAAIMRMLGFRRQIRASDPLWATCHGNDCESRALSKHGLQKMLRRLGRKAGVTPCAAHRFRRTFALWCLRDGMDLHSLRMLMGHSSPVVLQRYLALAGEDIERAHLAHSPVDRLLNGR